MSHFRLCGCSSPCSGTILAFFIMPESSRRSPAEIHEMFTEGVSLRKWRGHKTFVERDLEMRIARGEI